MKANTRLIKVLVPSVIAVIIIAVVSIMIVRGNNKDSSVSENPTTAPAVEEKQIITDSDKTEESTEIESQVEEVTETPTEEIEVPTEVEEQTQIENTYYEEQTPTYNEPAPTYEEPDYTPPASSGKIDSLINGDDDNSSYGGNTGNTSDKNLKWG